ncbi:MAG: aminopeptidase N, partial [Halioglobus sp.]|nr:aminopeptidase N [Halioglobus sp.]
MREASPGTIYLKDYTPPDFLIARTDLHFELFEDHALVHAQLHVQRNTALAPGGSEALQLHGQELQLEALSIDGRALAADSYEVDAHGLRIPAVPDAFLLACTTRIRPQDNTSLEGLYKSRTMFCTQCEAEGFRKITYYLDRPDVMNALNTQLRAELTHAVQEAGKSSRAVVITGVG